MVGILRETIMTNHGVAAMGLAALPASTSSVLWATAEESWIRNPLPSIGRMLERSAQRAAAFGGTFGGKGGAVVIPPDPSKQLHPEAANARYAIPGHLTFEEWISEETARDLYELKRAELRRAATFARAQGGFGEGAAQLAVGFLVSAMDPLNIASAFIPSVGPARAAIWAGRIGRPAARGVTGAIEGAVGATLLEPLVLAAARGEQADYDAYDSFLNVAFGTVLGGGLHIGVGAVGDVVARRVAAASVQPPAGPVEGPAGPSAGQAWQSAPAHRKQEALSAAVASLAEGRAIDDAAARLLERHLVGRAYDDTLAQPQGHFDDNLVTLSPKIIEDVVLSRGGWKGVGDVTISGDQGWGTAKIIWRHGEQSNKAPEFQVAREDVLALPDVLRDYEPSAVKSDADGSITKREYRVTRPHESGERTIVYGISRFVDPSKPGNDGRTRVVSIFVQEPGRSGSGRALSQRRAGGSGSPDRLQRPGGDTAPGAFDRAAGRRNRPASENIGAVAAARNAGAPEDAAVAASVERQAADAEAMKTGPEADDPVAALDEETGAILAELKAAGEPIEDEALAAAEDLAREAGETAKAAEAAALCLARRGS